MNRRALWLTGLAVLVSGGGGEAHPAGPAMPAPASASYARGSRENDDLACRKCHAGVAADHVGSLHAASWSDPSFQRGYATENAAFCRSCHAPESAPDAEPDAWARAAGVTCVTCHRPAGSGAVLAATRPGAIARARAPHDVVRVDGFGTRACAACHEFAFPHAESLGDKGRMQKTMSEHAASSARDRSCAECHMNRAPRASHAFAASRDVRALAAAVDVRASRDAESGEIVWTLASKGVGHALPTGDLFRRLVLRVKTPLGAIERPFTRSFRATRDAAGTSVRFEAADTRLAEGHPQRIAMTLPGRAGETSWELVYQRVVGVGQTPPFTVNVDDELVLARGAL